MSNEELVKLIQEGKNTKSNMEQLYQNNRGMIARIAMRYQGYGELEDLQQEGFLALYDAVAGYDADKGVLFISYATYAIKQRIKQYIDNCCSTVRIPTHEKDKMQQYKQITNEYLSKLGRRPTVDTYCYKLHMGKAALKRLEAGINISNIGSLDVPIGDGEDGSLYEVIEGESFEDDTIERIQEQELKTVLWDTVDGLPGQQPEVIRKRFVNRMTYDAIGGDIGANRSKVRDIQCKAIGNLRNTKRSKVLREYYDGGVRNAYMYVGVEQFNRTWTSATEKAALGI